MTGACTLGLASISFTQNQATSNYHKTIQPDRTYQVASILDFESQIIQNLFRSKIESPEDRSNTETATPPAPKPPKPKAKTPSPQPIPAQALKLIREFEGFKESAYIDTDGTPVIGYGLSKINGKQVQIGDRISVPQAEAALKSQLHEIQKQIKSEVKVKLNDNQLSALTSLAFNVGVNFISESTLVRKLNAKDYVGAANEFPRWDKANVGGSLLPLEGLARRRQAERTLFLTPIQ
jgi:GH24 family phage-related lysozyme (muramidase)